MKLRRWVALFAIVFTARTVVHGEVFRFKYFEGERYRVRSVVDEEVFINDRFSHRADILNTIAVEIKEVADGSGFIEALFQTSERSYGSHQVYEWGNDYRSLFWRDGFGKYDIGRSYFMPVVRDVPLFPDREIQIGESWSLPGEEVHDLRTNFGIADAYHFPINVSYRYLGKYPLDGREFDLITIDYTVFFKPNISPDAQYYPVRIAGFSAQKLYWDNEYGRPYSYHAHRLSKTR